VFVVRNDVLTGKPGQVYALIKSLDAGIAYLASNATDGQAIISKAVGADPKDLETAFKGVKFYSLADNKTIIPGDFGKNTISLVYNGAKAAGIITKDLADPTKSIDPTFVNNS
jgi:NitT/TauT family transport system substrate-binding protein